MCLHLQTRSNKTEAWSTVNTAEYSSDLGYMNAVEELDKMKALYFFDHRFIGHQFRIIDSKELN